jgi:hypothetical protein
MSHLQNCDQVLFADMRIALGRGNRCVSEKLLYHSDIDTILQKQSSNRVAQLCGGRSIIAQNLS